MVICAAAAAHHQSWACIQRCSYYGRQVVQHRKTNRHSFLDYSMRHGVLRWCRRRAAAAYLVLRVIEACFRLDAPVAPRAAKHFFVVATTRYEITIPVRVLDANACRALQTGVLAIF